MKNDGKQYARNLEGLRDVMWDVVTQLKDGQLDKDKAGVMVKGAETIVKTYVAEVAHQNMLWEREKRNNKLLVVGQTDGGEGQISLGEPAGVEKTLEEEQSPVQALPAEPRQGEAEHQEL